jgi:hypothetical protein
MASCVSGLPKPTHSPRGKMSEGSMDPPATIVNRGVMIDESSPQDERAIESRVRHAGGRGLAAPAPANE